MKKAVLFGMLILLTLLTACGNTVVKSNEEMLEVMKAKENLSSEIIECGTVIEKDRVLTVGITGENEQTYHYYAGQFLISKDQKYKFDKMVALNKIGWQIRHCKWQNGYVIVCNNGEVAKVEAIIREVGGTERTAVFEMDSVPCVHYIDVSDMQSDYEIEYVFFDSNGNAIK